MNKEQHVEAVDAALDALAADSDVTLAEYIEALDDLKSRIEAAAQCAKDEASQQ